MKKNHQILQIPINHILRKRRKRKGKNLVQVLLNLYKNQLKSNKIKD